jgi:nicotinate-nucleotide pyrophosphorylase (carboxylating)
MNIASAGAVQLSALERADVPRCVARALDEDIGSGDLTARIIDASSAARAHVLARERAVICGRPWFDETFRQIDPCVRADWSVADGVEVEAGTVVCRLAGPSRSLLGGERTALNFLQILSGTATITRAYCALLAGHATRLLDTRKTVPGLRLAQKYAVRCGGGTNHRTGLYDAFLIKENHIAAAGSIAAAIAGARRAAAAAPVEIEVETLDQLAEAIAAGADSVLLDNFDDDRMRAAVTLAAGRVKLEASGGIDASRLRAVAATGVDYISIGALTKHVRAVDLSMRFD